jgi:hypothetical protein
LIKHHVIKTYGEWRYGSIILGLGARLVWVVIVMPEPLHLLGKRLAPHLTGGWFGSRAGLGVVEKRQIFFPY